MGIYQELELTEKEYSTLKKVGYTDSDIKGMFYGNASVKDVMHIREEEYTGLLSLVEGLQQKIEESAKEEKKTSGTKTAVEDALRLRNRELQEEINKLRENTSNSTVQPKVIIEEKEKIVYRDKEVKPTDYEEIKKKANAVDQLVKDKEELKAKISKQETIIAERDKTITSKDKRIDELVTIEKGLHSKIEGYEQKIKGIQTSDADADKLKKEHEEMAAALSEALKHVAKLEDESKKLQEKNDELSKELDIEKADNEAGKERAIKETERLNEQITKLKKKIEESSEQIVEEQEHSDSDYEYLQAEYKKYQKEHSHTDVEYENLVQRAKTNNQVVSKADDFLGSQEKEDEVRKLKQRISILTQSLERAEKDLKKKNEEESQITGKNRQKWVREGAKLFAQGAGLAEGHTIYAYGMQGVEKALNKWT